MTTINKPNRLINEKSPYLIQHAYNPVDWYAWGDEAFDKAKNENKPIFLSIGYSTCHWCHVMSHESFEDEEVSKLMNETFVSIKVDREERPDIDNVYMTVCQMMTGSGGWPLTIIMTPDKKPFFAGTYYPKYSMHGRMGMVDLCSRVKEIWDTRRNELLESAEQILKGIKDTNKTGLGESLDEKIFEQTFIQLQHSFDSKNGGFGSRPKFPTPHNLLYLLRYYYHTGNEKALEMVNITLEKMSHGGIFDHLGYGFHRYSTDRIWLLPHFEKMLYDQAMLGMAYTEAYQLTKRNEFKEVGEKIFEYVLRDLASPEGAFYSAEDADSEGEEGKFYVWTIDELTKVLSGDDLDIMTKVFNLKQEGNFKDESTGEKMGANILYLKEGIDEISKDLGIENLKGKIEVIQRKLFEIREKRVRPHRDDKILTDWNGLMIAALSIGSKVYKNPMYSDSARSAAKFILNNIAFDGGIKHRYREGEWAVKGNVDDYAFMIFGLMELYEATLEVEHLKYAVKLMEYQIDNFWDEENGGFYFTSGHEEEVLLRTKEIYDGAIPSGNSVSLLNLIRLGKITGNPRYEKLGELLVRTFSRDVKNTPSGYTMFQSALKLAILPTVEIAIAGKVNSTDTVKMFKELRNNFIPNKVVIFNPVDKVNDDIYSIAEYVRDQKSINDVATAYVCRNYACSKPTTDPQDMIELIKKK